MSTGCSALNNAIREKGYLFLISNVILLLADHFVIYYQGLNYSQLAKRTAVSEGRIDDSASTSLLSYRSFMSLQSALEGPNLPPKSSTHLLLPWE